MLVPIQKKKMYKGNQTVVIVEGNISQLAVENSFDLIFDFRCIHFNFFIFYLIKFELTFTRNTATV